MNRYYISLASVALLLAESATPALAQQGSDVNLGAPQGDIGVKVSESSILHVSVTAEAGYDTNVFYNDADRIQSAVLRVIPSLQLTNAGRTGEVHSETTYDLGVSLLYREYLSSDQDVRAQRAFNPSVHGSVALGGSRAFQLSLADQFTRTEDPPYNKTVTGMIIRDNNVGSAGASIAPGGGRLTFTIRYTNTLDYFEDRDYKPSTNMAHDGMLDASWKWLPKTAIFLQGGVGYIHYLNPSASSGATDRHDSVPIRGLLGLRGLLTPKTTVSIGAGYATALYQGGGCDVAATSCNPRGFSNVLVNFDVGYAPTLMSKLGLNLTHGFRNSPVVGDFYDVDAAGLTASQMIAKLVLRAFGRYEYRRYHASPTVVQMSPNFVARRDHVVVAGAQLDYFLQRWFYAGVAYSITLDRVNDNELAAGMTSPPVAGTNLSYTKQQVLGRIGVTY
jgi:hypothetical protein